MRHKPMAVWVLAVGRCVQTLDRDDGEEIVGRCQCCEDEPARTLTSDRQGCLMLCVLHISFLSPDGDSERRQSPGISGFQKGGPLVESF